MKIAIGAQLAELRKQAGYTQVRLGQALGFSDQYISRVEKDKCAPSWRYLAALAQLLQIPAGELLERAGYGPGMVTVSAASALVASNSPLAQLLDLVREDVALTMEVLRYAHYCQEKQPLSSRGAAGEPHSLADGNALLTLVQMVAAHPELLELLLLWRKVPEEVATLVQWGQRFLAVESCPTPRSAQG